MKFEVDLKDIFFDEDYGSETIEDSIKRQVLSKVKSELLEESKINIKRHIDAEIQKAIDAQIKEALLEIKPRIVDAILHDEYYVVDTYGRKSSEKTSFRAEIVKHVSRSMTYDSRSYDKNEFTRAVDIIVQDMSGKFKAEYDKTVNELYLKETMDYAITTLRKRLGL